MTTEKIQAGEGRVEVDPIEARIEAVAKEWAEATAAEQALGQSQQSPDPATRIKQETMYIKAMVRTRAAGVQRDKLVRELVELVTK